MLDLAPTRELADEEEHQTHKAPRLYCYQCGWPITRPEHAIQQHGSHQHGFVNPAGQSFHIGCFRPAPGCTETGPASRKHSWFAGWSWQVSLCAGCAGHLGWRFEGAGEPFYGLILARLSTKPTE